MIYSCFSIVQASDLKEILEEKKLVREEVTIASVDTIIYENRLYDNILYGKSFSRPPT